MMNILVMESIPKTVNVFLRMSSKFREVTALRKKIRNQTPEDPMVLVGITIIEAGAEPQMAVLLRSQARALFQQQPLRDGLGNWKDMQRVEQVRSATGL